MNTAECAVPEKKENVLTKENTCVPKKETDGDLGDIISWRWG